MKRLIIILLVFVFISGIYAQTDFPAGNFWSLNGGLGIGNISVEGPSFQTVIDPRLWLSPALMIGSKVGLGYSFEDAESHSHLKNILSLESQVYLRWNFLRLGSNPDKKVNIYGQTGIGVLAAFRSDDNFPFTPKDIAVVESRASFLADVTLGVTIPLSSRLYIEPSIRGGYLQYGEPHLWGATLSTGYKFPLPGKVEKISTNEILRKIVITQVEYILFGPDLFRFNEGVDADGRALNDLTINYIANLLSNNPNLFVRLEGHANPVTRDPTEVQELAALSENRANEVARLLRARGVSDEQIVVVALGGTRTLTSNRDRWNINRRVEMMVIQGDIN